MPSRKEIPEEIRVLCSKVTKKRPKTVIDHILKHGLVTTEELTDLYGYGHAPRAARDVREQGIPLETVKVKSTASGRTIGAYRFADTASISRGRIGGRKAFSKAFKKELVDKYGARDAISHEQLHERYLQIDHRIPYEISGDGTMQNDPEDFMLIDASNQRAKSWSCEHCPNFAPEMRKLDVCKTCFWAFPESYSHVATEFKRRVDIIWAGEEVADWEKLEQLSMASNLSLNEFIKSKLQELGQRE